MKISEEWLRSYIDPSLSIQEIASQLTNVGLEIDGIETDEESKEKNKEKILSLKIPPNRGDCLSVQGIARELAAINQIPLHMPEAKVLMPNCHEQFPVKVESPIACPRYAGRVIKDINLAAKTPDWIQTRLHHAGIRSLSLAVDVTNYVMLELGQPLHAFDLKKLDSEIIVRFAKEGETLTLLDGKELTLDSKTLLIADKTKPLALAGIMGGENSGVDAGTKVLFLESAYFDPIPIRLSARRYGLLTESAYRFERSVDKGMQTKALDRATELLLEVGGGQFGPMIEFYDRVHLPKNPDIFLRRKKVNDILGIEMNDKDITELLSRLEMKVKSNQEGWLVEIPSFRNDISREIDLIEEVARIFGFAHLRSLQPSAKFDYDAIPEQQIPLDRCKQILVDRGYFEAITYSFIDPKKVELFGSLEKAVSLKNPLSSELGTMRTSLLPGLLQAVQYNQRRQVSRIRFFESGLAFIQEGETLQQKHLLAGVCVGSIDPLQWGTKTRSVDFFDVKADIETLVKLTGFDSDLHFKPLTQTETSNNSLHTILQPGKSALIFLKEKQIGYLGTLHPNICKAMDLEDAPIVFELELGPLTEGSIPKFKAISKFPAIRRDIAVIVKQDISSNSLKSSIAAKAGSLLQDIVLFDVYQGKGVDPDKKSIALGLILQHPSRTLVEEEVNELIQGVVEHLSKQYQATLRE